MRTIITEIPDHNNQTFEDIIINLFDSQTSWEAQMRWPRTAYRRPPPDWPSGWSRDGRPYGSDHVWVICGWQYLGFSQQMARGGHLLGASVDPHEVGFWYQFISIVYIEKHPEESIK
jgi:hypothetical protein